MEALLSEIKKMRPVKSDCEILNYINASSTEKSDAPSEERIKDAEKNSAAETSVWKKSSMESAKSNLLTIESFISIVRECNKLFPEGSDFRTKNLSQFKSLIDYSGLRALVMSKMSNPAEKENFEFLSGQYNSSFMAMRVSGMTETECDKYAENLKNQALQFQGG